MKKSLFLITYLFSLICFATQLEVSPTFSLSLPFEIEQKTFLQSYHSQLLRGHVQNQAVRVIVSQRLPKTVANKYSVERYWSHARKQTHTVDRNEKNLGCVAINKSFYQCERRLVQNKSFVYEKLFWRGKSDLVYLRVSANNEHLYTKDFFKQIKLVENANFNNDGQTTVEKSNENKSTERKPASDAYDPASDLMMAFGGRCESNGSLNNQADRDGDGIKSILEAINNDDNCQALKGALNGLAGLQRDSLQADRYAQIESDNLSRQSQDLELALNREKQNANPDQDYILALKTELYTTRVDWLKSQNLDTRARQMKRTKTTQDFVNYANNVFLRLQQSDKCLTAHPNVGAQLGVQLLGLGSTLANGPTGSLMLATGQFLDQFMAYLSSNQSAKNLKGLMNYRLGKALGCAFESLATTYCEARDIESVIVFNQKNQTAENPSPWVQQIDTIGKSTTAYRQWTNSIYAGSAANTTGQASDKISANDLVSELNNAHVRIDASLNSTRQKISGMSSQQIQIEINALISKLTGHIMPGMDGMTQQRTGPFVTPFSQDMNCGPMIYIYSNGAERKRRADDTGQLSCSAYVQKTFPLPTLEQITTTMNQLLNETQTSVNLTLAQVNESNPSKVLAQVDKLTNGRSAREFMQTSLNYLNQLLQDPNSIAKSTLQKNLIIKTKRHLENALAILEKSDDPLIRDRAFFNINFETIMKAVNSGTAGTKFTVDSGLMSMQPSVPSKDTFYVTTTTTSSTTTSTLPPYTADKKLSDLSVELIPTGDTFAVPSALIEIVNQDIAQKIKSGDIDSNLATIMQLSADDSVTSLIRNTIGIMPAQNQISDAKGQSKQNLKLLAQVFAEPLNEYLESLNKEAKDDPDAMRKLGLMCMQILTVPDVMDHKKIDLKKYCSGKKMQTLSGLVLDFDEQAKKSQPERTCAVFDFYRKSRLQDQMSTDKAKGAQ